MAKPSRAEPEQAGQSRAEPSQVGLGRAYSHAEPSWAKPGHAEPGLARPRWPVCGPRTGHLGQLWAPRENGHMRNKSVTSRSGRPRIHTYLSLLPYISLSLPPDTQRIAPSWCHCTMAITSILCWNGCRQLGNNLTAQETVLHHHSPMTLICNTSPSYPCHTIQI